MRKFLINVNGKSYEVEVEEVGGVETASQAAPAIQAAPPTPAPAAQAAPAAPVAQPSPTPAPAPAAQPSPTPAPTPAQTTGTTGSVKVNAPMPGNIIDIRAKVGDTLKKGEVVLILEAMKMENEIMAPQDGRITSVNTSKGSIVNSGDLLFSME
jgi:biotin carboxyl carrier protein